MLVMVSKTNLVAFAPNHVKHPCTLWAAASSSNFKWLGRHAIALFEEYTARYGKRHAYQDIAEYLYYDHQLTFDSDELTPFALCMPDEYKCDDPVISYRRYYKSKARFAKWKQNKPEWWG
jgi:hypothetical protein